MRFIVLWSIKCIFCFPRMAAAIIQLWNTHLLPVLHKCACSFSIQRNFAICAQLHCPSNDAIISALHKVGRIKSASMGFSHWFLSHHKTLLNISCLMSLIIRVWLALQGIRFFLVCTVLLPNSIKTNERYFNILWHIMSNAMKSKWESWNFANGETVK